MLRPQAAPRRPPIGASNLLMSRAQSLTATALLAVFLAPNIGRAAPLPTPAQSLPLHRPSHGCARLAASRRRAEAGAPKSAPAPGPSGSEPLARAAFWGREAQIDPTDVVAGVQLASALRALGQYDTAIQSAGRVLVIDPKNMRTTRFWRPPAPISARARASTRSTRYSACRRWRQRTGGRCRCSASPMRRGAARHDDAQTAWRAALVLSPENPAVLSNMAMEMAAQGDAPGAEALLRRAVVQPGATLTVRQDLTLVLGLEGKLGEAEGWLRRDLPPDQADADLAYLQAASSGRTADATPAATPAQHSWDSLKSSGG